MVAQLLVHLRLGLALRGIRTFAIRMQRSQENALELAKRLANDPRVSKVRYPGLASDPNHATSKIIYERFWRNDFI